MCLELWWRRVVHMASRKLGGRMSHHHAANETIRRALVSGGVTSILEPVGVRREDARGQME